MFSRTFMSGDYPVVTGRWPDAGDVEPPAFSLGASSWCSPDQSKVPSPVPVPASAARVCPSAVGDQLGGCTGRHRHLGLLVEELDQAGDAEVAGLIELGARQPGKVTNNVDPAKRRT
jgi:hypothetical protein